MTIWARQPQGPARVNRANPMTRGLTALVHMGPAGPIEVVSRRKFSRAGTTGYTTKRTGKFATVGSTNGDTWALTGLQALCQTTDSVTLIVMGYSDVSDTTRKRMVRIAGSAGTVAQAELSDGFFNYKFAGVQVAGAVFPARSDNTGNVAGEPLVMGMTRAAGVADVDLYVNGAYPTSTSLFSASTSNLASTATEIYLGSNNTNLPLNGGVAFVAFWRRALTAEEHRKIARNPWQLFAEYDDDVLVGPAAGGSSYTDSLTDTGDASDSATTVLAALGTISDTGALTDTASSGLSAVDALTDSGALADTASSVLSAVSALADSAAASETITSVLVTTEALADSAAAADVTTGTVGAQSYTDLLTDAAASTDSFVANVVPIEPASGGWDFFLRPIRHRDPPETLPEARKAVKTVARKAKKLRERADELAAEAAHLARQSEQRERTEATIAEMRSQVQQYEQIATQLRIHVELLIEQQREEDDLEILLLAA